MSIPKPHDVSPPFLMAVADPDVDYFAPIQAFASERVASLAKRVIHRLQRMPAVGIFEETGKPLKSVWDEWCWYQAKFDSNCGMLSDGFENTLDAMINGTVEELPQPEAVLISCGVCEDQEHMPARSNDDICAAVRAVITDAASLRSMAQFEVW